jgi:hypothetical protein
VVLIIIKGRNVQGLIIGQGHHATIVVTYMKVLSAQDLQETGNQIIGGEMENK